MIDTTFSKIYGGSGRIAKYAASKVASVNLDMISVSVPEDTENPINSFQVVAQE